MSEYIHHAPRFLVISLSLFWLFRATPARYGGSKARDLMGGVAASLHHSPSSTRSLTTEQGQGSNPRSWIVLPMDISWVHYC